ncbi:MAG: hypothetical protein WC956_00500 [bacterium]
MGLFHSCGAVPAIGALVISTALLIWIGEKAGNPFAKLGKLVGWVCVVLSALILIWSIVMCVGSHMKMGCPMTGPAGPGMQMMRPMHMGPGEGMGRMQMPPPPPAQAVTPEKK